MCMFVSVFSRYRHHVLMLRAYLSVSLVFHLTMNLPVKLFQSAVGFGGFLVAALVTWITETTLVRVQSRTHLYKLYIIIIWILIYIILYTISIMIMDSILASTLFLFYSLIDFDFYWFFYRWSYVLFTDCLVVREYAYWCVSLHCQTGVINGAIEMLYTV